MCHTPILSILNQLATLAANSFAKDHNSRTEEEKKSASSWPSTKIVTNLFMLFTSILRGENLKWASSGLNHKIYGLQGATMLIHLLKDKVSFIPFIKSTSESKISPVLVSLLSDQSAGYTLIKETTKLTTILLEHLLIPPDIINTMLASAEAQSWKRVLTLNAFASILSSKPFFQNLLIIKQNYLENILKFGIRRIVPPIDEPKKHRKDTYHSFENEHELTECTYPDDAHNIKQDDIDQFSGIICDYSTHSYQHNGDA